MAEVDKNDGGAQQLQPGQVVAPGAALPQPSAPVQAAVPPPPSQIPDSPPAQPVPTASFQPVQAAPRQQPAAADPAEASFVRDEAVDGSFGQSAPVAPDEAAISWTASEFVAHEKSPGWYLGLMAVAAVIAGFVFFITRDIISTVVVLIGAGAFGVLGSRKPQQQQYILDGGGLTIGRKRYDLSQFRSFSVIPEGAFSSIVLMPLKRFAQMTTIYYAPEDENKIVDLISQSLPFEERRADAVDNLMKRVRF